MSSLVKFIANSSLFWEIFWQTLSVSLNKRSTTSMYTELPTLHPCNLVYETKNKLWQKNLTFFIFNHTLYIRVDKNCLYDKQEQYPDI